MNKLLENQLTNKVYSTSRRTIRRNYFAKILRLKVVLCHHQELSHQLLMKRSNIVLEGNAILLIVRVVLRGEVIKVLRRTIEIKLLSNSKSCDKIIVRHVYLAQLNALETAQ